MRRSSKNTIPGWGDDDDGDSLNTSLLGAEVVGPGQFEGDIQLGPVRTTGGTNYDALSTNDSSNDGFTGRRLSGSAVVFPSAGPGGRTTRGNSEADKQRISNDALARQQANNDKFMAQLKQEEDAFLARIKQKKVTEDADAAFARQLQDQEEAAVAAAMGGGSGGGGGQQQRRPAAAAANNVQTVRITIPADASSGDVLRINVPGVGLRDVIVPPGAHSNAPVDYEVEKSSKTVVRVTLPQDTQPGNILTIKIPNSQESVQVAVPDNAVGGATLQFEVASSRVPPPVHAVGQGPQLGSVADIYGGPSQQPPQRQRRESTGLLLMSDTDREAFLSAMPEDLRSELRRQYEEELQEQQQSQVTTTNAEKMAFYAALPPDMRDQVMAEEARQERALLAQNGGNGGGGGSSGSGGGSSNSGGGGGGSGGGAPPPYQASPQQQGDSKMNDEQVTSDTLAALNNDDDTDDFLSFNNKAAAPAVVTQTPDDLGGLFDGLAMGGTASAAAPVAVQPVAAVQPMAAQPVAAVQPMAAPVEVPTASNATNPFDGFGALPTYDEVVSDSTSAAPPAASPAAPQAPVATLAFAPAPVPEAATPPAAATPEPPLERLRKARVLLAEGLIEQSEFDEIKVAVLAQLKGN